MSLIVHVCLNAHILFIYRYTWMDGHLFGLAGPCLGSVAAEAEVPKAGKRTPSPVGLRRHIPSGLGMPEEGWGQIAVAQSLSTYLSLSLSLCI